MISVDKCVHCHKCRDNCAFLSEYGIDICDVDKLRELAYHCFLCGRCTAVCPVGIDGRELIMDLRRERASSDERAEIARAHKGLLAEKSDYKFRNWKHVTSGTIFFPGCNFPSMYPKTNAAVVKLFAEHGIGTVYECCGKPVSELGFSDDEERILSGIRARLKAASVSEIVTACPNCKGFFGDRLGVEVKSIYRKLTELGIGNKLDGDKVFYLPCPDRTERAWIEDIKPFINGKISINDSAQCCGLGGSAVSCEKEIAAGFVKALKESSQGDIYTYCASCTGRFRRCGLDNTYHILPLIMGTGEKPDTAKSYINRVFTRFK